jgi:hypothetical protein
MDLRKYEPLLFMEQPDEPGIDYQNEVDPEAYFLQTALQGKRQMVIHHR